MGGKSLNVTRLPEIIQKNFKSIFGNQISSHLDNAPMNEREAKNYSGAKNSDQEFVRRRKGKYCKEVFEFEEMQKGKKISVNFFAINAMAEQAQANPQFFCQGY